MESSREESKPRRTEAQNGRPTIGFLTGNIWAGEIQYPTAVWTGVADAARKQDANLICFSAGTLSFPSLSEFEAQHNLLFDLPLGNVDGLVISSGSLSFFVSEEKYREFCDRYRPLPMVSIALEMEGIPSVLVDNVTGLRDAIGHLIEAHGHRRVAFVRGHTDHKESDQRYRAYVEALAEHGLDLDPGLVAQGDFTRLSGAAAMRLLLDERKLRPGVDFEAVVASTDNMALGALDVLQARGIPVPYEVALVGFDDAEEAKVATPSLTTVRQPIYEQGKRAVDMLLALLAGEDVPEQVTLPTEMVVRRSCGCYSRPVLQAAAGTRAEVPVGHPEGETFEETLVARREEIVTGMVEAVASYSAKAAPVTTREWAEQLLDSFAAEMADGSPGAFLSTLDQVLRQVAAASGDPSTGSPASVRYSPGRRVTTWQGALSALRTHVLPCLGDDEALSRAENLWQQARLFIAESARQARRYRQLLAERQSGMLQEIGQVLATTVGVEKLMDVIAQELPRLGIRSGHLSLYEGQGMVPQECRLILACDGDGRTELEPGGRRYPCRELVPEGMLPQDRCYSMVVQQLDFGDDQLGFVLLEAGPRDGAVYEAVRRQISNALQGALHLQERRRAEEGQREALAEALQATQALEKAYAEVEKKVEERTAELARETAERERLQQGMIEAQKRAIQELSTPVIPIMERIIIMPLIGSIDSMRARDITRRLLAGIRQHQAKVVILDITGVSIVDTGVAGHLDKTIQAARLKGARTIVTGISDAVAETIVDLGIDWGGIETLSDLQTGLRAALGVVGLRIEG